jgi:cyclic pyranopterin phosphate synthase
MVVLKGYNENDVEKMMGFCARVGAILQLIEYEASKEGAQNEQFRDRFFSLTGIEEDLERRASEITYNELHRRRQYLVSNDGRQLRVELVRPMHNTEFCGNCTRIRISSDGRIKPCLMERDGEQDVLGLMRNGATDAALRDVFLKVVAARRPYWS